MINNSEHFWTWIEKEKNQNNSEYMPKYLYIEDSSLYKEEKNKSTFEEEHNDKSSEVDFTIFQL